MDVIVVAKLHSRFGDAKQFLIVGQHQRFLQQFTISAIPIDVFVAQLQIETVNVVIRCVEVIQWDSNPTVVR